ncbi:rRNA-processing protein UTP22 KNAG_0B01150 [Huiozyma naganishii CBS 8797]|uniref:U3 small nucleolar RNA-associated protein 22 n=1 Tax=Huiozyma naganishii (strain ATCC MYA-139 / BCRC 22969 / CBS 8797 / KCTC 17520 / NBRC 10181 / NCYC 3082 / Yp74L-3) TaxID=1071383 RepID=J7RUP2_HUIN7|nr:hypothetical protein KNAG_0B01150 [Kazachstania naganishii CBS 8797]CCK68562.1 hypothetical protein KNAG_0B01150 [Kazachstania naganishii CBS 8797]
MMSGVKRKASELNDKTEVDAKQLKTESTAAVDETQDIIKTGDSRTSQNGDVESDSENDDDHDEEEEEATGGNAPPGKSTTSSQDIHLARETAELFKSNIFKLQIDELLEQVKLNNKHILKVEKFLHKLYDMIQLIPEWEEQSLTDVQSYFKGKITTVPFVDPKPTVGNTKYNFNYLKPDISLVGSFALKTGIYQPQGSSVDILLTMPKSLFEKKDFLNFRCLHKRSVYLAYLTHHLSVLFEKEKWNDFLSLEFKYFNNDNLLPILTINCAKPTTGEAKLDQEYNFYKTKFSINLIIGFPEKVFEPKKLLPNKNCIRVAQENTETHLPATPLYNFSILFSSTYESYLKYLYKAKKETEAFRDASILGRLWLQQRGFSSKTAHSGSLGGFGNFEFTTLMAALLNGGGVNGNKILLHGFSSYQLFKGVIKYLATMDLCTDGHLQFHSDINYSDSISKYVDEGFKTPTIFDKTTKVNILTKMTVSSYGVLKMFAKETLKMLNNVVQDQFANIFLTNISKSDNIKYDLCYDVEMKTGEASNLESLLNAKFTPIERVKYITVENFLVHRANSVINYALGDRISAVEVELVGQKNDFSIKKRKVYSNAGGHGLNFEHMRIKIMVNPAESEKLVTKGPAHSEEVTPEATFFKNFWGPKASLRRFKDGSITHCCVWSSSASEPIISFVLDFILKRHITERLEVHGNITKQFQNLLPLPNLPANSKTSILNLNSFYDVKKSFDKLYKIVFKMNLPLSIKSILPIGSAFRYTSICQLVPYAYSNPDFLQDVILEFETSQKWPDEITSLEKAKTAFLLKIHEILENEHNSQYKSFFTRDESIPFNLDVTTLNVLTQEGYGFRFRILTERDEILYLRAISNARNEIKPLLENTFLKFTAKSQGSVRHTRTIENISHAFPLYTGVVRLFKKWLDSHLLLGHLNDELVELIAMKPFVDPAPFSIPGSLENGFLKILKFISQWNWREDPLILDLVKPEEDFLSSFEKSIGGSDLDAKMMHKLSERLTLSQYKDIQANFNNLRKTDPNGLHLQFFIASRNDPSGILYSSNIPLAICTRLTALAKVAINLIQTHGLNKQTIELLFAPGLNDYDFVIHLRTPHGLRLSSGVASDSDFKNISNQAAPAEFPDDISLLSEKMDPTLQLVKYLNMKYKNSLIFSSHRFIGVNGGKNGDKNVITGLIKPAFKNAQKFRVNIDCNVKPVDAETVELNKDALFQEIAAFGNDLVVDFQSK